MNIILFDTEARKQLYPLTLTKAVADLRMGILTVKERWEKMSGAAVHVLTDGYLQHLYETPDFGDYILIDACIIPDVELVKNILNVKVDEAIKDEYGLIAGRMIVEGLPSQEQVFSFLSKASPTALVKRLLFPFEMFQWNKELIELDFSLLSKGRISHDTNDSVHIRKASQVFIEDGASIEHSILNASTGPIYIGNNATIMEGCTIRGPFAMGEGAVLKMGTRIYGATTIGPYCMGGGEIKNSILSGYSNKAHDGYLGDSVIGEWCNMGAGTSNSNLKNTGGIVNLWSYAAKNYLPASNKCGVVMGDYSRTAINSSVNTGSVIGVCSNVFGAGLLPKFIPDFTWGSLPTEKYRFDEAIKDIHNWKKMKNKTITAGETQVLKHIFELSVTN